MQFNRHSNLEGQHAFLSASSHHWVNYDLDKLILVWRNMQAKERGTRLHDFARRAIELGIKLPRSQNALNRYVNDAIGFRMTPEQVLYYSVNCFGTADAISFRDNMLRIHDLKTGTTPVSMVQLEIYASLFCLEYHFKPDQIRMELRIYQGDEVVVHEPDPKDILGIMDRIELFDREIERIKAEG